MALLGYNNRFDNAVCPDGLAYRNLDHAGSIQHNTARTGRSRTCGRPQRLGVFLRIVLPISFPGIVAAFILCLVLSWNEYFFAALLTSADAKKTPCYGGQPNRVTGNKLVVHGFLSTAAIARLGVIGIILESYIVKGLSTGAVK
ncbi:MAG: hypothetical protein Ct9H300mP28_15970 [Pseudomonadota bacterium]|nr:MAG: hypothetical protein Ct9H300mP28_15970 [Pseudomonadota bacterium]